MARNLLVTVCNEPYAEAAKTLVASVHRTSYDVVDEIVLYDLGILEAHRAEFERMEKVTVRDFPPGAYRQYTGYMAPRGHGYKLWILDEARLYAEEGDRVLWLDPSALTRSAAPIYELIERLGVFAVEHDIDKLTQRDWTTPLALDRMEASERERNAVQMWGGIFGWVVDGPYQSLVDQAFAWSLDPQILLGPVQTHRFDQSILSTLCTRYDVPFQPQAIYGEWRGADVHPEQVVFAHRRAYVDHSGLRFRPASPPVVIPSSDASIAFLRGFIHQFRKHGSAGERLIVGGFTRPGFRLDENVEFRRLGAFADYPIERWSDAFIELLESVPDELVVVCMDDYWLTRPVDVDAVARAAEFMRGNPDVARFDLNGDIANVGRFSVAGDVIECAPGAPFRFGLQCAIWRRELLLRYLVAGETPWETEINGTVRMEADGGRAVGTREPVVEYLIALQRGRLSLDGGWQEPKVLLSDEDLAELEALGHLPLAVG